MTHILVLTAKPRSGVLSESLLVRIRSALDSARKIGSEPKILATGEAWEDQLTIQDEAQLAAVKAQLTQIVSHLPIDVTFISVSDSGRRKKLLIADMDSTIINQECIDEIADHIGIGAKVVAITERAMRGELDFDDALSERVTMLKGLDENELQQIFDERITLMPGARTLVQTMRANGAYCALVSGGFTFFTSRIANQTGFDVNRANTLDIADGKLAGSVAKPILGRQAKLDALRQYSSQLGLTPEQALAVGDGANDLAMITAAGLGVAYHAKPIVAAQATASIVHGDLTALLYLQGYSKDEFVA